MRRQFIKITGQEQWPVYNSTESKTVLNSELLNNEFESYNFAESSSRGNLSSSSRDVGSIVAK